MKQRYINKQIIMTLEQIKKQIQYGDYVTLGKMFNLPTSTVKSRFLREDEKTAKAMVIIIKSREKMIEEFKEQLIKDYKDFIN